MTLKLVWTCDECGVATSKMADDPTFLSMPKGWSARPDGGGFQYACPGCRPAAARPSPSAEGEEVAG
jgi:hypothetical protein